MNHEKVADELFEQYKKIEPTCLNCGSGFVKVTYYTIPLGFGLGIRHEVTNCKSCGWEEDFEMS